MLSLSVICAWRHQSWPNWESWMCCDGHGATIGPRRRRGRGASAARINHLLTIHYTISGRVRVRRTAPVIVPAQSGAHLRPRSHRTDTPRLRLRAAYTRPPLTLVDKESVTTCVNTPVVSIANSDTGSFTIGITSNWLVTACKRCRVSHDRTVTRQRRVPISYPRTRCNRYALEPDCCRTAAPLAVPDCPRLLPRELSTDVRTC